MNITEITTGGVTTKTVDRIEHSLMAFNQWASRPADERFESVAALKDACLARALASNEEVINLASVVAMDKGAAGLALEIGGRPVSTSHFSFGQLCGEVRAPASYLRRLDGELAAANLNYNLRNVQDGGRKAYLADGDGPTRLRAITSESYARVYDWEVVAALEKAIEDGGNKFYAPPGWDRKPTGLFASDRDVWAFVIDGGSIVEGPKERDQLYRGVIVSNSEVRDGAIQLRNFMFRQTCGNLQIWGISDYVETKIVHRSGAREHFYGVFMERLREFMGADMRTAMVESMKRAESAKLPYKVGDDAFIPWAMAPLKGLRFTRQEAEDAVVAALREEGQCESMWDYVNGLTAVARGLEHTDAMTNLSRRAGKLVEAVA